MEQLTSSSAVFVGPISSTGAVQPSTVHSNCALEVQLVVALSIILARIRVVAVGYWNVKLVCETLDGWSLF